MWSEVSGGRQGEGGRERNGGRGWEGKEGRNSWMRKREQQ